MKEAFSVKNNADALIFHTAICFWVKTNTRTVTFLDGILLRVGRQLA